MLLLEQDTIKKKQVDENITWLEFEVGTNKKYEIKAIWDSAVYHIKESRSGHLLDSII